MPGLILASDLTSVQPKHVLLERFIGNWSYERWTAPAGGAETQLVGSDEVSAEMVGGFSYFHVGMARSWDSMLMPCNCLVTIPIARKTQAPGEGIPR